MKTNEKKIKHNAFFNASNASTCACNSSCVPTKFAWFSTAKYVLMLYYKKFSFDCFVSLKMYIQTILKV